MSENPTPEPEPGVDEAVEPAEQDVEQPEPTEEPEPDTFPREYVEKLRKENATYRDRAKDRDTLAQRLHAALTAADGRLAAPDELPFDEVHLSDPDALTAAIDDLLARKPYLAARRLTGSIGQGPSPASTTVDLAGIIRSHAG